MLISIENLVANEYKQFSDNFKKNTDTYVCSYQKRFDNCKGKKFYITITVYDLSKINMSNKQWIGYNFSAEVQYNRMSDGRNTFNVKYMINNNTTIQEMEDFFDDIWVKMECNYYDIFNEY